MNASCTTLVTLGLSGTMGLAQPLPDYNTGYDLVVAQHPTRDDPTAIVQVWAWTDLQCDGGSPLVAAGQFDIRLSHPIEKLGSGVGYAWYDCKLDFPLRAPCDAGFPPSGGGGLLNPFAFLQVFGPDPFSSMMSFDNPLNVMDIYFVVDDLTPRNVTLTMPFLTQVSACVYDDVIEFPGDPLTVEPGMAVLRVNGGCPADFDGDGELTIFDFLAFQNAFAAGDAAADFDGDGELTLFDFLAFQNAFDAGCE
ncbi:MAG: GC-type dockerin domain-anchored protein [Phycisphaerales bacterium]